MVGDQTAELDAQREALIRDAEGREILAAQAVGDKETNGEKVSGDGKIADGTRKELELQVERPQPRVTEADKKNDTLSLNRKLDQTLYLLVKNKEGRWRFPEDRLFIKEDLNQVCPRWNNGIMKSHAMLTYPFPGRRAHHRPIRRSQHEHLGRRQPPSGTLPLRLPQVANPRAHPPPARGRQSARDQHLQAGRVRREGFLHEGAHHGRPGRRQQQYLWRPGFPVAHQERDSEPCYGEVLEQHQEHACG